MERRTTPCRPALCGLAATLLGLGCQTAVRNDVDEVRKEVYHSQYEQAVREAAQLREQHPGDPAFEELHRQASLAYLLEQGRRATFQDRDLDALTIFRQAKEMDPASAETDSWIEKTLRKLSRTWLERGLELHASGKLAEAVDAYEKALEYTPGDPSALNGLGDAIIQINYRDGMGKQYFEEGIHSLSAYWLEQARSRFSYSDKYQPGDAKTLQRTKQVGVLLAQQRVTVGKGIEATGRFGAARNEYRLAAALDPENADAREGLERCTNEAKASKLLEQAKMEIVRLRLDHAVELIEEGEALTSVQKDMFEGARAHVEQSRFEQKYQAALALERDFQYEKAIGRYDELLKETEYYKDAIARKETLDEYVRLAAELYEKAKNAATDADRLESLRKIRVFWPEYRDVSAQLAQLEKADETPPR